MASWTLVPCLVALRNELNELNPGRDKRSDGTIGDRAHQDSSSDHNPDETGETPYEDADSKNEVHALDADDTGPWPGGIDMGDITLEVARRHRTGLDDRLQNIIYNRRIASRSWGWTWRDYTGSNAHTEHAHFSARYTSAQEASTRPWGLTARFGTPKEIDVPLDTDQVTLTPDAAKALDNPTYPAGKKVSGATLLQLALIHACRAEEKAEKALAILQNTPPPAAARPATASAKPAAAPKPAPVQDATKAR